MPKILIRDKEISSDSVRAYVALCAEIESGPYDRGNAALARAAGLSPAKTRSAVAELLKYGWVTDAGGLVPNSWRIAPPKAEAATNGSADPTSVYTEDNTVVSNDEVVALIRAFVESGLNPKVNAKNAYGSPWHRKGGIKLIAKHGMTETLRVIKEWSERKDEDFCPQADSLWAVWTKWDKFRRHVERGGSKGFVTV